MKKFILICALLLGASAVYTTSMVAAESSYSYKTELPDDARPIRVFKIVQGGGNAWSTSQKDAYYSPSEHRIYVTEGRRVNQPYEVHENRAYGQEKDGRAEYRYTAAGYYFNL
ncbi:MAG: hypothetical protein IAC32_07005 [Bacteroidetes bacterium]|uniref:Lactococcin 972 family bacteriocin n=1 Tax=Candidatus Enterocola intestinipullorum TaxID=2840783 RepID=A0A9D9EIA0_9BACT|nr:hypothetical protein [Candidatus Enterocola intestinipullorum]